MERTLIAGAWTLVALALGVAIGAFTNKIKLPDSLTQWKVIAILTVLVLLATFVTIRPTIFPPKCDPSVSAPSDAKVKSNNPASGEQGGLKVTVNCVYALADVWYLDVSATNHTGTPQNLKVENFRFAGPAANAPKRSGEPNGSAWPGTVPDNTAINGRIRVQYSVADGEGPMRLEVIEAVKGVPKGATVVAENIKPA